MTPEEIRKLAEEYVAKVYGGDTDFIDEAENVISWLLRSHCIVEKSIVRVMHTALSKEMSMLNNWEEREIFKARISMLNYLFGKDLFNDDDRT